MIVATVVVSRNQLPALAAVFPTRLKAARVTAVQAGVASTQAHARVRTGYMRDQVQPNAAPETGYNSGDCGYSVFNEFGTYRMSSQPFFRPGFQAMVNDFVGHLPELLAVP